MVGEVPEVRQGKNRTSVENYGKSPPTKTGFGKLVKEARKHDPTFNAGPVIVAFEKIDSDEPIWHVTIAGSNGRMTITDIRHLTRYQWFNEQCGKQLNRIFPLAKQDKWLHMLQDAMSKMTVVEAEEDTTRGGEFRELLEIFSSTGHAASGGRTCCAVRHTRTGSKGGITSG